MRYTYFIILTSLAFVSNICYNLIGDNMLMISILDIEKNQQHAHAHSLLRECLKKRGIDYNEKSAEKNALGKPYLPQYPEVHYNLSHADGIAACIVSCSECGIDCERIRPLRERVMKRAFSESEKALIEKAPENERDMMFIRLWTLKEAYGKAIGKGIAYPMNKTDFSFREGKVIANIKGYEFRHYIIKNKFALSICEKCNI